MKLNKIAFILFLMSTFFACQKTVKPTEQEALTAIDIFLKNTKKENYVLITDGTVDFSSKNVQFLIEKYNRLKEQNLIKFAKKSQSKTTKSNEYGLQGTFLSDSKLNLYEVSLSPKAKPYILETKAGRHKIKSSFLSTKNALIKKIEKRANQTYKVEIELGYETTPFAILEDTSNIKIHSAYLLHLNSENNWEVQNEIR